MEGPWRMFIVTPLSWQERKLVPTDIKEKNRFLGSSVTTDLGTFACLHLKVTVPTKERGNKTSILPLSW